MRKRSKLIPAHKLRLGQEFTHYGQYYRAATAEEASRHPGRRDEVVLAYMVEGEKVTPVAFNPLELVVVA